MAGSNKAKIAKRVVEVLEYFDDRHREATVMDIVRRYGHPQSSTSELLSSMVDLGLLYKDNYSRSYRLTPRAGLLGISVQPDILRNGSLNALMDDLTEQTALSVGIFGMVNLNAQIFAWRSAPSEEQSHEEGRYLFGGQQERLCDTAAGWMLLSTIEASRRDPMLRHMQADGGCSGAITLRQLRAAIELSIKNGHIAGPAGFGSHARMCAVLLPDTGDGRPMALAMVHEPADRIDEKIIFGYMKDAVARLSPDHAAAETNSSLCKLVHAA